MRDHILYLHSRSFGQGRELFLSFSSILSACCVYPGNRGLQNKLVKLNGTHRPSILIWAYPCGCFPPTPRPPDRRYFTNRSEEYELQNTMPCRQCHVLTLACSVAVMGGLWAKRASCFIYLCSSASQRGFPCTIRPAFRKGVETLRLIG